MVKKDNFEEYSIILKFVKLSYLSLNNYSAEMRQPYPRAMVCKRLEHVAVEDVG